MDRNAPDPGLLTQSNDAPDLAEPEAAADNLDPASYRDLTKEEVLDRLASGYQDLLDGKIRPAEDAYDELGWQGPDDAPQD